ncbi:conserved Plasmodium protein, unknown function [Plasmodium knowlesi strain H]|uniref:Uncharacterized protein n=3 Tax=Plasmodium knowlesi TaxID=5850 RepID=A0A5K1TXA5_PLAKH|nr:conserved Plasmodium protein, unknown function [Plasmodium knowlesi strain H]OTN68512.1 Uncharacterized protein PKNOH_S02301700 [Plasmodium knowlesi]CAA9986520.1 conserved Plasmodium protein, unknown function [Plasmodium knowlesi strain H]SBO24217.1 conserved Plasmodium protein, unknown function [Plasmodium knowlesi strain H]SBO29767.1 conserved Plasmodium protein, unknown function [Plasmodium knowlesi strain H]VVS75994.1 conserved Plasmodium protein, unknown function [Plasmodium knowlesi s|eukprot:XP_002261071.1 hypothetical protein, conserved in Plasmodium species [Plasmodium knowlesi strain H]
MRQSLNRGEVREGSQYGKEEAQGSSALLLDVNAGNSIVKCDMLSSMHEGAKQRFREMFHDDDNRVYDEELGLNIYIKNIWIYINLMCTFSIHDLILISRSFKNTEIIYDDVVCSGKEEGSIFKDGQGKRKNSLFIYFENYKIRKNVVKIFLQNPYAVCFIHKNGSVHVHGALTLKKGLLILIKVIKRLKYKTFWTYLSGCNMGVPHQGVELQVDGATTATGVIPCDEQIVHTREGRSKFPTLQENGEGSSPEQSIVGESTPEQSITAETTPEQSITEGGISPDENSPKKDKEKVYETIRFCETVIEELRDKIKKYEQDVWEEDREMPTKRFCQGDEKKEVPFGSSKYYLSGGCKRWTCKRPHAEVPSQLGHEPMHVHSDESKISIQMEEKRGISKVDSPKRFSSEEYKSGGNDKIENVPSSPPPHLCDHVRDSSELIPPNRSTVHFKPSNIQGNCKNEFSSRKENDESVQRQHYDEVDPFSNEFEQFNQLDQSALHNKKYIYQFDTYRRWKYITRNDITFDMDHLNIKQLVSVFNVKLRYFDISKIYKYKEFKNILTDINNIIYIRIDHSLLCKLIQQDSLDPFVQNNFAKGCRPNIHPSVRTVLLFSSGNVVLYACKSRREVLCVSRFIVNTLRRNNNIAL